MNTNTNTNTTCRNMVERRSGTSATTGAGPRAGAYTADCGKPTIDGARLCPMHKTRLTERLERLRAIQAQRQAVLASKKESK